MIVPFLMAVMLPVYGPSGPIAQEPQPIVVEVWVSRTAVWAGDEIEYAVRLVVSPGVELEPESLSGDAVRWAPFRLLGLAQRREARADGGTVVTLRYRLLVLDLPAEGFAELPTLRFGYARRSDVPSASGDLALEEEIVEGPGVVFRSMLGVPPQEAKLRDDRPPAEAPASGRAFVLLGLGGLLLGLAPLGHSAYRAFVALRTRREAPAGRRQKRRLLDEVVALERMSVADPQEAERFWRAVHHLVVEHLATDLGIEIPGLTSADGDELRRTGLPESVAALVSTLVLASESARYGTAVAVDVGRAKEEAISSLRALVGS